jgi:hypothetical protein
MSIFDSYRQRRREISGQESVATLDHMKDFFGDGQNWAQHVYQGTDGGRCLVAAANHVRVSSIDDAKHWLRQAIAEKTGLTSIEQFNDKAGSFAEIQEILGRARELARAGAARVPALVGEVLPPVRAALPSPVANTSVAATNPWAMPVATTPAVAGWPAPAVNARLARDLTRAQRRSLFDWSD